MSLECRWVEERLEARIDGDLSPDETARVDAHVRGCDACRASRARAEALVDRLRALPRPTCPEDVVHAVELVTQRRAASPARAVLWGSLAASLLVALLVAVPDAPDAPSAREIARAEREARLALALVSEVLSDAETRIRDDVLIPFLVLPSTDPSAPLGVEPQEST